ncbi:MAG: MOSC domain-containing protein [Methyloprofundus sp.]|nr:MOSC domain-containing protein [Methyloprofundus sp.]
MARLSAIYIYPVKSLSGIQLTESEVTETGFQYDRQWMLVDKNNQFLSQRRLPKMALIKTKIHEQMLIISAPNKPDLKLPLTPETHNSISINIWGEDCTAETISIEADQWFSDFLKQPCQLVYQANNHIRQVDQNFSSPTDRTSFSDGFPFLIISAASLRLLNEQMNLNLSMERFRPNIVLEGCTSYEEDTWRKISIGAINFRLPKPCSRCSIPQIDPKTAISDKEPLRTLSKNRQWNNKVFFGQNALHDATGTLKVGDSVSVCELGSTNPPLSNVKHIS